MTRKPDFVDEMIEERTKLNPEFPLLVEAAIERRRLMRRLAAERERAGISQTVIAARMGTSQSSVARIETGEADVRLSTIERYAAAVGKRIAWTLKGAKARKARGTISREPS